MGHRLGVYILETPFCQPFLCYALYGSIIWVKTFRWLEHNAASDYAILEKDACAIYSRQRTIKDNAISRSNGESKSEEPC